jgi:hypothetical protein
MGAGGSSGAGRAVPPVGRGSAEAATNAGFFAADSLQKQQTVFLASMKGCTLPYPPVPHGILE